MQAFAQLLSEQGAGLDAQAVADLIFIACNEGAETTCVDLCDFDERNTKVLASQGHTPTPGRGPGRIVTRGQLREQQQEGQQQSAPPLQEEQQQSAPSLLEQLLLTCLVAGELGLLRYLAERTEAANLSELQSLQCWHGVQHSCCEGQGHTVHVHRVFCGAGPPQTSVCAASE